MANYKEPYEDLAEYFKNSLSEAGLETFGVDVKVLANDKLKEIGKVKKANDLINFLTDYDVVIEFNEEVFERLEDSQKQLIADELVTCIHYNTEKDKINIENPDIATFSGIIDRYGAEVCINTKKVVGEVFDQLKDEKEAEKETV